MPRRSPLMNVLVSAVNKASRNLRRDFGEVEHLQVKAKGPSDFVTKADRQTEKILFQELKKARPDYGFLMEEHGEVPGERDDARFIIDPIDGTTNFIHAIPHFALSVAVEERGELVAGVVYNPINDELFWAEKGQGAYLNDQRLRVSGRDKLEQAVLATGFPHRGRDGQAEFMAELGELMPNVSGIRRMGAASLDLAYVAAGRYDGYWEAGLGAWDIAAGIILVTEAGGYVRDASGGTDMLKTGGIIAANDYLQAPLERALKRARREMQA